MTTLDRFLPLRRRAAPSDFRDRLLRAPAVSDVERVQRVGAIFMGSGALAFVAISIPVLVNNSRLTQAWWPPVSLLLIVVPSLALVTCGLLRRTQSWLVPLAVTNAVAFLAAVLLWLPAAEHVIPEDQTRWTLWMLQFPVVPALVLVIARLPRLAFVVFVVNTLVSHCVNQLAVSAFESMRPPATLLLTFALSAIFLMIGVVTVRTAELLDSTRTAAIEAGAADAASVAREAERSWFTVLIHDKVIASLLAVDVGTPDPRLVRQAELALAELDAPYSPAESRPTPSGSIDAAEFACRIRTRVTSAGDGIKVEITTGDAERVAYPAAAADAICDAMDEAIRNVARHAGSRASCLVAAELSVDGISVLVIDDGRGFDPAVVGHDRFGLRKGIIGRMSVLPGGEARVESAPGSGTTIGLGWIRGVR